MKAGVVILGGGEATRLPGKLTLDVSGVPLVVRTFRNVSEGRETFVSCKSTFAPEIDALLEAPLVVDRWPRRGPLAGLLSTMSRMHSRFVFAVAGDAPFVDAAFLDRLEAERRDGDEAVVPAHGDGEARVLEPLAALYDRAAFMRHGFDLLRSGNASVLAVVERLCTRTVTFRSAEAFRGVNTPDEYRRLRGELRAVE